MNKIIYVSIKIALLTNFYGLLSNPRSIHRPKDPLMPRIEVQWWDGGKKYLLEDSHLEYVPLFKKFDGTFFLSKILPNEAINYRIEKEKSVEGKKLSELIEQLLTEIYDRKKEYTHFTVLKDRDFNRKNCCGLIVLKFKEYPFVVKLFMETPESFVNPSSKGSQPYFFFIMGGGINRHLSGFTRIKNLETIREHISKSSYWSQLIDMPRKWFWLPVKQRWLQITSYNISTEPNSAQIPATYAIVSDAIDIDKHFNLFDKENREFAIRASKYLGIRIDAHIDNFMMEKITKKVVLVDTEHFPTMVGLTEPFEFNNYLSWYLQLMAKFTKDKFLRHKKYRRELQQNVRQFLPL